MMEIYENTHARPLVTPVDEFSVIILIDLGVLGWRKEVFMVKGAAGGHPKKKRHNVFLNFFIKWLNKY